MKIYTLLLLVFYNYYLINAQSSVSYNDDNSIIVDDSLKNQLLFLSFTSPTGIPDEYIVTVVNKISADTLQVFSGEFRGSTSSELLLEDVNFDSIEDLLVLTDISASGGNLGYDFWVYDTSKHIYIYDSMLTSTISCNPGIDSYNREYTTYVQSGCVGMCWTIETFKLLNGEMILIKAEYQEFTETTDKKTGEAIFKRTLVAWQNNTMVVVKTVTGTPGEIERKWEE